MTITTRTLDTPIGELGLVASEHGLQRVLWPGEARETRVADPRACSLLLDEAAWQLGEYFAGTRTSFDLPLDLQGTPFQREAWLALAEIPYGETAGYGEVAIIAGSPRAARAVGTACATTPFSIVVPVHRVVRADGSLGEYGGRPEMKQYLIDLERAAGV